jgi:hypothetical protein
MAEIFTFSIDNRTFPNLIVKSLKRSFQILDGPLTGRNLRGEMLRDIIGTYFNYDLDLECTKLSVKDYDDLYEIICSPNVDSHSIIVPYAQKELTFNAYISSGDDTLKIRTETYSRWGELGCKFIAMAPQIRRGN